MPSVPLFVGDPVPWFSCRSSNNPNFHFDTVAGTYTVLSFYGSVASPERAAIADYIATTLRPLFDDRTRAYFGVSTDPEDERLGRLVQQTPGVRFFWDFDRKVSELYGALDADNPAQPYKAFTLVLDPLMRVLANITMEDVSRHNEILTNLLNGLPQLSHHAGVPLHAPVLVLPRVLEPSMCKMMIELYQKHGGYESGFMRDGGEQTVAMLDGTFKRRRDFNFESTPEHEYVRAGLRDRIRRRLVPEIKKAFQFDVTHIERFIVACYDGEEQGFFRTHRDNTTRATAHRRFACTINLNAEEFEGGELRFPEFGPRTYRAPTGGALVFSCSLLHEATPVTKGVRYAFLPFFYDHSAAELRKQNRKFLSGEVIRVGEPAANETPDE
jgi:peroxiredoxin